MPYRQLEINYPIFTPLASIVCARDVNGSDSVYMCFETSVILLFRFLEYGHRGAGIVGTTESKCTHSD